MRAVVLGAVLAVVLLELVLQVASYVAWRRAAEIERPPGRVLLCIGDSVTHGLGAELAEAYPARLEEALRARGSEWSVVNAGVPGNSSADVLSRLPGLLQRLRPEAVCVLVGCNDAWARPAPLDPADLDAGGFPLRWRTGRLLALLSADADVVARTDEMPFLGAWHIAEHGFYFAADGTARLDSLPATWTVEGDVLHVTPAGGETVALRWRRAERALEFSMSGWNRFLRARRGPPTAEVDADLVADLIHGDQFDAAIERIPAGEGDRAIRIRAAVVVGLLRAGRTEQASALVPPLQRAWEVDRRPAAGEAVALWFAGTGRPGPAIEIARELLAERGDRVLCWRVLVDCSTQEQRAAIADELAAAAAAARDSPWRRAELTLERAVALAEPDPAAAVDCVNQARSLGVGPDETIAAMKRAVRGGADGERLLAAAERVELPPSDKEALRRDLRRAAVDDAAMWAVVQAHLDAAVGLARAAGARVFLLGYPFALPEHEAVARRVAAARGAVFVSMVAAFEAELASAARDELFVDPIHCSARGYRLMAEVAARRLARELR